MRARFQALLAHPRLPFIAGSIGVLLALPSLGVGWLIDDYVHRFVIQGGDSRLAELLTSPNPFAFLDGTAERTGALMDMGIGPWWTHPHVKAVFWRPITALFMRLDHALWLNAAWAMHAHSLVWFGLAVCLVGLLYRRLGGATWGSGLAAILFALDDAHAIPAAWIANRNVLLALVFGVLAVLFHHKWRQGGARWAAPMAVIMLTLSLLSKEEGLATTAYLFAYAVFLDRAGWRARVLSLVPYALTVVLWRIAWTAAGGGVENIGLYADPLASPSRYLWNVVHWSPALILGQWAFPPPEAFLVPVPERLNLVVWLIAVALIVLMAVIILPYVRRDRLAGLYALGMALSVLPVCATGPADRLLGFVGLGAMGLLARFLESWRASRGQSRSLGRWVPASALAWMFVVVHLVFAPLLLLVRCTWPLGPPSLHRQLELDMPVGPEDADRDFVLLTAPSLLHVAEFMVRRSGEGEPVPRSVRLVSPTLAAVRVERVDERTIAVRPAPPYLALVMDQLFRPPSSPFGVGDEVRLSGMRAVIAELDAKGRPSEVRFQFDVSLEDPSLKWFRWEAGSFVQCGPPTPESPLELDTPMPSLW